jgi:SAM-dependent methyltransferase
MQRSRLKFCCIRRVLYEQATMITLDSQLLDTQRAFDSVAPSYDGPRGNNSLIQRMRALMWREIEHAMPSPLGTKLIDLGCGTGLDALHFAQLGYDVCATDWSPEMVQRTAQRARENAIEHKLQTLHIGLQELHKLAGVAVFDGAYSNFGPLNCAPKLRETAKHCARLIKPGGKLVCSVIGRLCPWELAHYAVRCRFARAGVRFAQGLTAVNLNQCKVWTNYYWPREFLACFAPDFDLVRYSALSLFVPPPYLTWIERYPRVLRALAQWDDALGGLPVLRDMGDHFLMVLRRC